jgi:hypothetical protein
LLLRDTPGEGPQGAGESSAAESCEKRPPPVFCCGSGDRGAPHGRAYQSCRGRDFRTAAELARATAEQEGFSWRRSVVDRSVWPLNLVQIKWCEVQWGMSGSHIGSHIRLGHAKQGEGKGFPASQSGGQIVGTTLDKRTTEGQSASSCRLRDYNLRI